MGCSVFPETVVEKIVEGSSVLGLINVDCVVSKVGGGDLLGVVDLVTLADSSETFSQVIHILSLSFVALTPPV